MELPTNYKKFKPTLKAEKPKDNKNQNNLPKIIIKRKETNKEEL